MWAEFKSAGLQVPPLNSGEIADLFAYFYSTLYFSPPGSSSRGRIVFEEKRCLGCHPQVLDTRLRSSILETWMDLTDPIAWAARMWNHAGEMDAAMTNRGIRWPKFSEQDTTDLLTFLGKLPDETPMNTGTPGIRRKELRDVSRRAPKANRRAGSFASRDGVLSHHARIGRLAAWTIDAGKNERARDRLTGV
jgi:hypothetical protein